MRKKVFRKPDFMKLTAFLLILISVLLLLLLSVFKLPRLQIWYEEYQYYLTMLEFRVAALEGKGIIIFAIFLLFTLKAVMPLLILPVSCVCVISAIVFNLPISVIINILGLVIIFSIRYYIGTKRKTLPYRILKSYDEIWKFLEHDGNGNPWLLFLCRIIPLFPINTVSNIYGGMKYDFKKYLLISVSAFLPKLISYSIIGRNAFNPFSASFIIPVMISSFLSGVGLLVTRKIILFIRRKGEEDVKDKNQFRGL